MSIDIALQLRLIMVLGPLGALDKESQKENQNVCANNSKDLDMFMGRWHSFLELIN